MSCIAKETRCVVLSCTSFFDCISQSSKTALSTCLNVSSTELASDVSSSPILSDPPSLEELHGFLFLFLFFFFPSLFNSQTMSIVFPFLRPHHAFQVQSSALAHQVTSDSSFELQHPPCLLFQSFLQFLLSLPPTIVGLLRLIPRRQSTTLLRYHVGTFALSTHLSGSFSYAECAFRVNDVTVQREKNRTGSNKSDRAETTLNQGML